MNKDNAFWRFSLKIYEAPGVAAECLGLQDTYGANVNLLLFFSWVGWVKQIVVSPGDVEACRRSVGDWDERVVKQLRAARRALKDFAFAEDIRSHVKDIELDAECVEQALLFDIAEQRWPKPGDATPLSALHSNLNEYLRVHGLAERQVVPKLVEAVAANERGRL